MGISIKVASYNTTLAIAIAGVAPLIWSPLSNVYGRRPLYLFSSVIGIVAGAGSAVATEWGTLLAARFFIGVGTSAGMGIGASLVSDIYYMHERGKYVRYPTLNIYNANPITDIWASMSFCMIYRLPSPLHAGAQADSI